MEVQSREITDTNHREAGKKRVNYRVIFFGAALAAALILSIYIIASFFAGRRAESPPSAITPAETRADAKLSDTREVLANLAPPTIPPVPPARNANTPIRSTLDNMVWNGAMYIMISRDNHICVYSADMSTLYDTLGTYVSTLPQADQDLLAAGITITSEDQLNQLIQAYSG